MKYRLLSLLCMVLMSLVSMQQAVFAQGTISNIVRVTTGCPTSTICYQMDLSCPGMASIRTYTSEVGSGNSGTVFFFAGNDGTQWYSSSEEKTSIILRVHKAGFRVVQLKFATPAYLGNSSGELACRQATMIQHVYDRFTPVNYVLTALSNGSGSLSSAVFRYSQLHALIDKLVLVSLTNCNQAKLCQHTGDYMGDEAMRLTVDVAAGFENYKGPCFRLDSSFVPKWEQDAVCGPNPQGFLSYPFPIKLIVGSLDFRALAFTDDYMSVIQSPITRTVVIGNPVGAGHLVYMSLQGQDAIVQAITNP